MRPALAVCFMETAQIFEKRGTCNKMNVGVVAVRDNRIILIGYNGSPQGTPHCSDSGVGCLIEPSTGRCIRTVHAEANLIAQAAKHGISIKGSILYITVSPCLVCAKLILSAGVAEIIYNKLHKTDGIDFLQENGITCTQLQ